MQFLSTVLFAATALASLATATNIVYFTNQDGTNRNIVCTAQEGLEQIPDGWIGNCYSVSKGAPNVPGMLAEFRFNGFAGATYFDVSAIVNPDDAEGVKMVFPKNSDKPVSGCQTFPCSNAYNRPDDVATLSTDDSELVVLIGNLKNERRRGLVARMSREYVTS